MLVLHEANQTGGFGAEIIARLHELFDGDLPISAVRLATPDVRMPAAPILQRALLPNVDKVVTEVRQLLPVKEERA